MENPVRVANGDLDKQQKQVTLTLYCIDTHAAQEGEQSPL